MGQNSQSDKELERKYLETLLRIEDRLDEISAKIDRNTSGINIILQSMPPIPVTPVLVSELKYNHKTKTLWADDRYYIKFDGKQAELLERLFTKAGRPKRSHLLIDTLVEESYDYAKDNYSKPATFYLRASEIKKKLDKGFRTKNLLSVTLKEVYFNHD